MAFSVTGKTSFKVQNDTIKGRRWLIKMPDLAWNIYMKINKLKMRFQPWHRACIFAGSGRSTTPDSVMIASIKSAGSCMASKALSVPRRIL